MSETRRVARLADEPAIAEALRWFSRERAWINEQHLLLCRIPAPTFFERQRAEWFRQQLDILGWTASLDRAGNVIASFGPGAGPKSMLVSAHLDTVFAPARTESVAVAPDGRLIGPGTSDNGSGLSALLALARVLAAQSGLRELASDILLVANVGEEGEGNLSGMRYLCQTGPGSGAQGQQAIGQNGRNGTGQHALYLGAIRAFIVLDGPSVDHITAQALASRRFEVTVSGPGGHSWNDHGTPNPVHAISEVVHIFLRAAEDRVPEDRRNLCSYNFSVIEGGSSINAIPASARAKLDIRSEDPALVEELTALVTPAIERSLERVNRTAVTHRLTAKVRDLGSRPGGKLALEAPLLRAIQAVDAHLQIRSRLDCASTDANVPLSMSLPAISIGAGGQGGGAHTESEWYQPEGRELGLRRVLLLLAALASERGDSAQ